LEKEYYKQSGKVTNKDIIQYWGSTCVRLAGQGKVVGENTDNGSFDAARQINAELCQKG
jgi:hypothetical protein